MEIFQGQVLAGLPRREILCCIVVYGNSPRLGQRRKKIMWKDGNPGSGERGAENGQQLVMMALGLLERDFRKTS